jgi:hypothetical protein
MTVMARAATVAVMKGWHEMISHSGFRRGLGRMVATTIASMLTDRHSIGMRIDVPRIGMHAPAAAHGEVEKRGKQRQGCDGGSHDEAISHFFSIDRPTPENQTGIFTRRLHHSPLTAFPSNVIEFGTVIF